MHQKTFFKYFFFLKPFAVLTYFRQKKNIYISFLAIKFLPYTHLEIVGCHAEQEGGYLQVANNKFKTKL